MLRWTGHPRQRHVHGARKAENGDGTGRRVRAEAFRAHAVRIRRMSALHSCGGGGVYMARSFLGVSVFSVQQEGK